MAPFFLSQKEAKRRITWYTIATSLAFQPQLCPDSPDVDRARSRNQNGSGRRFLARSSRIEIGLRIPGRQSQIPGVQDLRSSSHRDREQMWVAFPLLERAVSCPV